MFKNLVDSFLVIDGKEKPAPSFLMAYIFTWLAWHSEVILTFFKIKGDFTTRFNAAYYSVIEYEFFWVFILTFVVIIVRYLLNSLIFYVREFFDKVTLASLNDNDHKAPVSYKKHRLLESQLAQALTNLLSSQDRESVAKLSENELKSQYLDLQIERDKYLAAYEAEQKTNIELRNQLKKETSMKIKAQESLSIAEKTNTNLQTTLDKIGIDNLSLRENLKVIVDRLDVWGNNLNDNKISALSNPNKSNDEELNRTIEQVLKSKIVYPKMTEEQVLELVDNLKLNEYFEQSSTFGRLNKNIDHEKSN